MIICICVVFFTNFFKGDLLDLTMGIYLGVCVGVINTIQLFGKKIKDGEYLEELDQAIKRKILRKLLEKGDCVAVRMQIPEQHSKELEKIIEFYAKKHTSLENRINVTVVHRLTEERKFFKSMEEGEFYETYRLK